ncbi:MAG: hypothetical protein ACO1QR_16160 [Chthoniobacteraceae bacterium]
MTLRRIARTLFLICLLLLAAAQSMGVGAAFLCLCSGQAFVTTAAECHGPHGEHCVSVEEEAHKCDDDPCDTEQHATLTQELATALTSHSSAPEVGVGILARELSFEEMVRLRPAPVVPTARYDSASRPPPGISVARTVVLLI